MEENNGWIRTLDYPNPKTGRYRTCGNYLFSFGKREFFNSDDFIFHDGMWKSNNLEICFEYEITHYKPHPHNLKPIY